MPKETTSKLWDLFLLLNGRKTDESGSAENLYLLLTTTGYEIINPDEIKDNLKIVLYLEGTNHAVSLIYCHPYVYTRQEKWRDFDGATERFIHRILSWNPDEERLYNQFRKTVSWCPPFISFLAFLSWRLWELGGFLVPTVSVVKNVNWNSANSIEGITHRMFWRWENEKLSFTLPFHKIFSQSIHAFQWYTMDKVTNDNFVQLVLGVIFGIVDTPLPLLKS